MKIEWLKFYNYNIKKFDMRKIIMAEFIILSGLLVITLIEFGFLKLNNKIFHKNILLISLIIIFLLTFLSFLLVYLNKKLKSKVLFFIIIIISPRFWGFTLIPGITLLYSYFDFNNNIYIGIIFLFFIFNFMVFFNKSTHQKISKVLDLKKNNILNTIFIIALLSYIIIGNSRYQLMLYGTTLSGTFRLATGMIILSFYFLLDIISSIIAIEEEVND